MASVVSGADDTDVGGVSAARTLSAAGLVAEEAVESCVDALDVVVAGWLITPGVIVAEEPVTSDAGVGCTVALPMVGTAVAGCDTGVEAGMGVPAPCVGIGVPVGAEPVELTTLITPEIKLVDRPLPSRPAS